jgi:uracil-DNA glycosylase family 4
MNDEFASCVASARALLAEFIEEGVEQFERLSDAELAAGPPRAREQTELPEVEPVSIDPVSVRRPLAPAQATDPSPSAATTPGSSVSLEQVRAELGECTRCRLCEGRDQIVFGDGNPDAALMFIGEGPGQEEDRSGLPFVGRAGELLTKMIEGGLGISRSDVYICNIVKCRPPKNRNPQPDEVGACQPFLDGQIDAVRPKAIVTLGRPATSLLLGRDVSITRMRGTWQSYRGIPVMPTFHPAYLLRQYTAENRRSVWEDLKEALARSIE